MAELKIGDFITQYAKGYWQIVDIKPKYASENRNDDPNGKFGEWKKGQCIGNWILMKKAFTPTMKFRLESDFCDSYWCKPVSPETKAEIDRYFAENPANFDKFNSYVFNPNPAISTIWLRLEDDEPEKLQNVINFISNKFTMQELMKLLKKRGLGHCIGNPPANYILSCGAYLWDLDKNFNQLYSSIELKKFKE